MINRKAAKLLGVLIGVLLLAGATQTVFAEDYYFRWTTPLPQVLCDSGGGNTYLNSTSRYYEYNLPVGATLDVHFIWNGVSFYAGNYPLPSGVGSGSYSPIKYSIAAPYLTSVFQYDTVIDGQVVYRSLLTMNCPDETAAISNQAFGAGGTCLIVPDGAVVGDMPNNTQAYWAPGKVSPDVTINAGTYWVVGEDESGQYYKIILACQYLWVPVDSMQPSYQAPWSGQPLPTRVVS